MLFIFPCSPSLLPLLVFSPSPVVSLFPHFTPYRSRQLNTVWICSRFLPTEMDLTGFKIIGFLRGLCCDDQGLIKHSWIIKKKHVKYVNYQFDSMGLVCLGFWMNSLIFLMECAAPRWSRSTQITQGHGFTATTQPPHQCPPFTFSFLHLSLFLSLSAPSWPVWTLSRFLHSLHHKHHDHEAVGPQETRDAKKKEKEKATDKM